MRRQNYRFSGHEAQQMPAEKKKEMKFASSWKQNTIRSDINHVASNLDANGGEGVVNCTVPR